MTNKQEDDFYSNPDNYNTVHNGTIMLEKFKNKEGKKKMTNKIETFDDLVQEVSKLLNITDPKVTLKSTSKSFYIILNYDDYLIEQYIGEEKCFFEFLDFPQHPSIKTANFNALFLIIKGLKEATDDNK